MKKIISFFIIAALSAFTASGAVYNVRDFGAQADGKTLTTAQIQSAIDRCHREGGGRVYVPAGEYLVGTLNLRSNVEFHLETGAVLKASMNLADYQRHSEQLAGIFYTQDAHDVAITGFGKIFGRGMEFMEESPKKIIGEVNNHIRQGYDFRKVTDGGVGDGPLWPKDRFHQMVIFAGCKNVTLRDFECIDAPYWTILIVNCNRVTVSGVSIDNNLLIPNSDGLDVVSCQNVNISDCVFTCGDDAIVLAGYATHFGDPGFRGVLMPSQNINVSNCILQSRSSAIRIGGWDANRMSNYNFDNITIIDSNCGINLTVRDVGGIENVTFSNIRIETRMHTGDWWGNGEPIKISALRGVPDNPIGTIRNIFFNNITTTGENSILMYSSDETTIDGIYFNNFEFVLRQSALEEVSGGNFDLRPNTVAGKELYSSDIPVVHIESASNIYFTQGNIAFDGVREKYHTHGVKAIGVDNLNFDKTRVQKSPARGDLPAISLEGCTNVTNNSK